MAHTESTDRENQNNFFGGKLRQAFDKASGAFASVAGWGMALVAFIMCYEIIMRYYGHPTTWAVEICGYSMVWFAFLATAFVLREGGHIQVDILILRLSPRTRNVLDIINYTFIAAYTLALLYFSYVSLVDAIEMEERSSTMLRMHLGWLYGGMLIGCVLMLVQSIFLMVQSIVQAIQNRLEGGDHALDNLTLLVPLYFALIVASAWLYIKFPTFGAIAIMMVIMLGGVPVFTALGVVGSFGLYYLLGTDLGLSQISGLSVKALDNYTLLAIPLYVLGGQLLVEGGVGKELFSVCRVWIGHWPGGALLATVAACAIFAAISGSSVATAASIGIIALPEMINRGYRLDHSTGVVAAGGTLGILIPPSAAMIIYSTLTEESTGALFMGGVVPGILRAALIGTVAVVLAYKSGFYEKVSRASWSDRLSQTKQSFWGLMAPVIVLVGIYTGLVTPTEAAAVIVVYALVISLVRGTIKIKDLHRIFIDGTRSSTMILMIVVGAIILGTVMTFLQVPQRVCDYVGGLNQPPWVIMTALVIIYVILGCFLEVVSILMITIPIVYPLVIQLGYNGIWFGVFSVMLMEMALITPPVGLNLYVIQGVARCGIETVIRGVWPYMIVLIVSLLLFYLVPDFLTWLPGTMGFAGAK